MTDVTSDTDFEPLRVLLENEKANYVNDVEEVGTIRL